MGMTIYGMRSLFGERTFTRFLVAYMHVHYGNGLGKSVVTKRTLKTSHLSYFRYTPDSNKAMQCDKKRSFVSKRTLVLAPFCK